MFEGGIWVVVVNGKTDNISNEVHASEYLKDLLKTSLCSQLRLCGLFQIVMCSSEQTHD